ncbi:MAG: nidogen-like domain-containing protein [Telluria sp.]
MKTTFKLLSVLALSFSLMQPASAIPLRTGFGGAAGYGELTQNPNDDGSSNQLNLPFNINFFGQNFNSFFVNNNGNVTFNSPLGTFTPRQFPINNQPVIAPFWADVDTRNQPGGGAVYVAAPNADTVVVTWNNVGYFSGHNDKLNDFQMTLLNRADTGAGNFDIEFRYNRLEWTTGDASGGSGGLGGTPAQAGYDAGDGNHFFVLPGSFSNNILNLVNTSNVSQAAPGLWTMAIRNGGTSDGSTPDAPLLPEIVTEDGFEFNFNIELGQTIFIDPVVAVGYEYEVTSGPNILRALFPMIAGDTDGYEVFGLDNTLLGTVMAGQWFEFGPLGVNGFRLLDIEAGAGLDPANPQAFVTGLQFVAAGEVFMTQDPITFDTGDNGQVPEPSTVLLLGLGALASIAGRRVRRTRRAA